MNTNRLVTLDDGRLAYVTEDGDMVDQIAFAYYGRHRGTAELVYAANRGLADKGVVLSAGVAIILPPAPAEPVTEPFKRLWD